MRLDLHVHTCYSADGGVEPLDYLRTARKIGLNGFAVTDHNEINGAKKTYELARDFKDLIVIQGCEVSSTDGHILAYGVTDPIPRRLTPEETCERVVAAGGVPVAAHPYRRASGLGEDVVKRVKFSSVEVLNHRSTQKENDRALELAKALGAGTIGGSDAHFNKELGIAATEFKHQCKNQDDVIEEIAQKRTMPIGESSTTFEGLRMYTKLVLYWIKRGFKRM